MKLSYIDGVIVDIPNDIQVFGGYYNYDDNNETTRIHLITSNSNGVKDIVSVEGYKNYCYIYDKDGDIKDNTGMTLKKVTFNHHPDMAMDLYEACKGKKKNMPRETDIPLIKKFMRDTYNMFQSSHPIVPRYAVVDMMMDEFGITGATVVCNDGETRVLDGGDEVVFKLIEFLDKNNIVLVIGDDINEKFSVLSTIYHLYADIVSHIPRFCFMPHDSFVHKLSFDLKIGEPSAIRDAVDKLVNHGFIEFTEHHGGGTRILVINDFPSDFRHRFVLIDKQPFLNTMWAMDGNVVSTSKMDGTTSKKNKKASDDYMPTAVENLSWLVWCLQQPIEFVLGENRNMTEYRIQDIIRMLNLHSKGVVMNNVAMAGKIWNYDSFDELQGVVAMDVAHATQGRSMK